MHTSFDFPPKEHCFEILPRSWVLPLLQSQELLFHNGIFRVFFERVTVPTAANIATNTFVLFQSEKKDIMTYARNIFAPLRLFKGKGSPSSADAQGGEKEFS